MVSWRAKQGFLLLVQYTFAQFLNLNGRIAWTFKESWMLIRKNSRRPSRFPRDVVSSLSLFIAWPIYDVFWCSVMETQTYIAAGTWSFLSCLKNCILFAFSQFVYQLLLAIVKFCIWHQKFTQDSILFHVSQVVGNAVLVNEEDDGVIGTAFLDYTLCFSLWKMSLFSGFFV
jgi:hypothetical protein